VIVIFFTSLYTTGPGAYRSWPRRKFASGSSYFFGAASSVASCSASVSLLFGLGFGIHVLCLEGFFGRFLFRGRLGHGLFSRRLLYGVGCGRLLRCRLLGNRSVDGLNSRFLDNTLSVRRALLRLSHEALVREVETLEDIVGDA
jgi:hypothetical protein